MTFWQFAMCMLFAFFCGVGFEKLLRRLDSRPSWRLKKERERPRIEWLTTGKTRDELMNQSKLFPPIGVDRPTLTTEEIGKEVEKIRRDGVFEKNFPDTAKAAKKHLPQMLKDFRERMNKDREHHPENDPGLEK